MGKTAGFALFGKGILDLPHALVFVGAVVIALASNFFGLSGTQNALAHGRAAIAIPLQDGVAQVVPVRARSYSSDWPPLSSSPESSS